MFNEEQKKLIEDILNNLKENYDEIGGAYYPEDLFGPYDPKLLYDYIVYLHKTLYERPDTEITLTDDKGNKFVIIQTERVDMQEKFNKSLAASLDKIRHLESDLWHAYNHTLNSIPYTKLQLKQIEKEYRLLNEIREKFMNKR